MSQEDVQTTEQKGTEELGEKTAEGDGVEKTGVEVPLGETATLEQQGDVQAEEIVTEEQPAPATEEAPAEEQPAAPEEEQPAEAPAEENPVAPDAEDLATYDDVEEDASSTGPPTRAERAKEASRNLADTRAKDPELEG